MIVIGNIRLLTAFLNHCNKLHCKHSVKMKIKKQNSEILYL